MAAYLFAHFIGEGQDGEQVYFSLSFDGLHWQDLNRGRPVLVSRTGACGVRDPFLVRDPRTGRVYLLATDERIASGRGWEDAQENGSRDIIVWETQDLVHWSAERSCRVGIPGAGCVWAPEAVFDREEGAFLVFFASKVRYEQDTEGKHRIYAAHTQDFRSFSETFLYMERKDHVIDTTILESGGNFYRISKDETTKKLILETSDSLTGTFIQIDSPVLRSLEGVEGPEGYLLPDGKTWCLIADQYRTDGGYLPMLTEDLSSGVFRILSPQEYHMGRTKKRHGGILSITDAECIRLLSRYAAEGPAIRGLYADPDLYHEDGIYYLYPTTDGFPHWTGSVFYVFTSRDGTDFERQGAILDVSSGQVPWAVGSAWAPCITKKDGRYYLYFCAKDKDGRSCIGAAAAPTPTGPFTAMPEPMVAMGLMEQKKIRMSQTIDPSVYQEGEDCYLLFGNGGAAIAKLAPDMVHIEEDTVRPIQGLLDFREAVTVLKRGDLYHFTWSCDDTGSEDYHVNYGISESLYGPVEPVGTILEKDAGRGILGTGHHSILRMPGTDVYLIAFHRSATPLERYPEGKGWHREVCILPLSFDERGLIRPVRTGWEEGESEHEISDGSRPYGVEQL